MAKISAFKDKAPKVKGTWLMDWAKIFNRQIKDDAAKAAEYRKYLTDDDWKELTGLIVPSVAYPYDFFRRLGRAIFHVAAGSSLDLTRAFGRQLMKNLLLTYKNMLAADDPKASVKKLVDYHSLCFINVESRTSVIREGKKSIDILLTLTKDDKKFAEAATAFAWQLAGNFEELATQAKGQNVQIKIEETAEKNFLYSISWE